MSSPRVPRPADHYLRAFKAQRELLANAARQYDGGSEVEARNLAVRIRVLVYDGKRAGSSLLAQLGVRDTMPYLDTANAEPPPGVFAFGAGLCTISAQLGPGSTSRYRAPLDDLSPDRMHPDAAFVDWWNEPISTGNAATRLTRRDLVLWVANQDGGAHVDPGLDETYIRVISEGLTTFQPTDVDKDLALPSVRQIAYELDTSMNTHLRENPAAERGLEIVDPICSLPIRQRVTAGRNDPCPCGSERKTKHCFGRRQRRRLLSIATP